MNDHAAFLRTFLRYPARVGAIAPSSPALVATMVEWFDWPQARWVVEYGPGTGVFTEAVAKKMDPQAKFFAIERDPKMAAATRRRCPGVTVYEDTVTNVVDLCRLSSMPRIDAIICGLPWASFPSSLQTDALDATFKVLAPGGQFATFAYLQGMLLPAAKRFSELLEGRFATVQRSRIVWKNLPPAFVYRCVR